MTPEQEELRDDVDRARAYGCSELEVNLQLLATLFDKISDLEKEADQDAELIGNMKCRVARLVEGRDDEHTKDENEEDTETMFKALARVSELEAELTALKEDYLELEDGAIADDVLICSLQSRVARLVEGRDDERTKTDD